MEEELENFEESTDRALKPKSHIYIKATGASKLTRIRVSFSG